MGEARLAGGISLGPRALHSPHVLPSQQKRRREY
jgi:hypothetical protein